MATDTEQDEALEQLAKPPIFEVVCGLQFAPVPDLDPVLLGIFWAGKREDYPQRKLHPPLSDASMLIAGVGPVRTWFVSADDAFVLQIQPDRFYLNWRATGSEYPRFNDHEKQGLLSRALNEFDQLASFCRTELKQELRPNKKELTKIDHLVEGVHWDGLDDLATVLPWLSDFVRFSDSEQASFGTRFIEERASGTLTVSVNMGRVIDAEKETRLVKIESRIVADTAPEPDAVRASFQRSNAELNKVFAAFIPKAQRSQRFA